ncbi:hypothetical protein C3L33_02068, partial [Rhododendron williamsianum]
MIKTHYHPPVYLRTRLVVFYTKCECLGDARKVLMKCPKERGFLDCDISAYSQRGYASEALNLFRQMLRSGSEPNAFTFASVLTSCKGALRVEYGMQIHSLIVKSMLNHTSMLGAHFLTCMPNLVTKGRNDLQLVTYASVLTALSGLAAVDHGKQVHNHVLCSELPFYVVLQNSLIDMYSKCGNLTYSRRIFDNMSERTVMSWNAMLVGYSKHGKGREPWRWEDVRNVRELMNEKAVIKEPGRSWIELNQTLHTFHASDRTHPRKEEVFAKVKELLVKIKQAGYTPDLSCVLHDVDEEQKEKILLGHSEKLALAFGLIDTPPGKPVQVMKNLRICVDCHNFAKFVQRFMEEKCL